MPNTKTGSAMKASIIAIVSLTLALFPLSVHGQEKKHPIDQKLEAAIEKDSSTGGQNQAIGDAHEAWDKVLNQSYQKLLKHLDPGAAKKLRESQRAWIAWRDKEVASLTAFYEKMQGTMWSPIHAYSVMELTRQRAIDLSDLAEFVQDREVD